MKNILITGTKGYISNHLANALDESQYNVERITLRNESWKSQSFSKYDVVIHTAALVHNNDPKARLSDYLRVNTKLTEILAKKAKEEGAGHFIYLSTMAVFGKEGKIGKDEIITTDTPLNPNTDYGISKLNAEMILKELETDQFKVSIIRPPMIYGPDCPGNFKRLIEMAKILPILPKIKNKRSALYINHLSTYIQNVIMLEKSGTFHPQDNFFFETTEVMHEIRKKLHKKTFIVNVPQVSHYLLNRVKFCRKLFGNLTYEKKSDQILTNTDTTQKSLATVIDEIVNYSK